MLNNEQFIEIEEFTLAYCHRSLDKSPPVVFIHGFGSAKEYFRFAFTTPALNELSLLSLDLVGFGGSEGPSTFSYSMKAQAEVLLKTIDQLNIDTFHLCAHSMGGLVAMEMAELAGRRVLSLIDLEGNLTLEDCFFSGKIAAYEEKQFFTEGRRRIERELIVAGKKNPTMAEYLETFRRASSDALYRSAGIAVADSQTPLIERLKRIPNACYVYGEQNRGVYPGEKQLLEAGFPVYYVADTGHAMATENPEQLYQIVKSFIDSKSARP